jgi:hypothetical protein
VIGTEPRSLSRRRYKGRILAHVINNSGATVMVTEERYCERLAAILDELG